MAPSNLFPFIYSEDGDFEWFVVNVIGPNSCEQGYLYVKNLDTSEIVQILDQPVESFRETHDYLYCVTDDMEIIQVDYSGQQPMVIRTASTEDILSLDYYNDNLYFVVDNQVHQYNLVTRIETVLVEYDNIISIYPYADNFLIMRNSDAEMYNVDITTGEVVLLAGETEVNELVHSNVFESVLGTTHGMDESDGSRAVLPVTDFPLPGYPVGSHFNNGLGECDHLNGKFYCKRYASTNQCDGFAIYAHEQYIHVNGSEWSAPYRPAGDSYVSGYGVTPIRLGSESAARQFFINLTKGAFIRYTKTNSDAIGFHSIVFVSRDSTGIWAYECNQDYKCGVGYEHYDYSEFVTRYPYVAIYVSHTFTGTKEQCSASYHMVHCSTSGCVGYILETHSSYEPGNNATCAYCGYVGKIDRLCPIAAGGA